MHVYSYDNESGCKNIQISTKYLFYSGKDSGKETNLKKKQYNK